MACKPPIRSQLRFDISLEHNQIIEAIRVAEELSPIL